MQSRTPKLINSTVVSFCQSITRVASPIYLPITPEHGARLNECFQNVQSKVQRDGGSICLGWAIWEWPRVWIEAEFHAVHKSICGRFLTDVSPSETRHITQRLFLPDSFATYDFNRPDKRIDNRRRALNNDWRIARFFELSSRVNKIMNKVPGLGEVIVPNEFRREILAIQREQVELMQQLVKRFTGPNDPCPCGSGLKLKKCHRLLR